MKFNFIYLFLTSYFFCQEVNHKDVFNLLNLDLSTQLSKLKFLNNNNSNQLIKNELQQELVSLTMNDQGTQQDDPEVETPYRKMEQLLREQEDQLERSKYKIQKEIEEARRLEEEARLAKLRKGEVDEDYQEQYELDSQGNRVYRGRIRGRGKKGKGRERRGKGGRKRQRGGKGRGKNQQGDLDDDEYADQFDVTKVGFESLQGRKPLQRKLFGGKEAEDNLTLIQLKAEQNKIIISSTFIILVGICAKIRQWTESLFQKTFIKTIRQITFESFVPLSINMIVLFLYFNNFFDIFFLWESKQRVPLKNSVRLIQKEQINAQLLLQRSSQEFEYISQVYLVNLYEIILFISLFIILYLFQNFIIMSCFKKEIQINQEAEIIWPKREEYMKQFKRLFIEKQAQSEAYKEMMSYPNLPPEANNMKKSILNLQQQIKEKIPIIEFLCLKTQFLQNHPQVYPYTCQTSLNQNFNFQFYMIKVITQSLELQFKFRPIVTLLIGLIVILQLVLLELLLFFFNKSLALFLYCILSFGIVCYLLINLNYEIQTLYNDIFINCDDIEQVSKILEQNPQYFIPPFINRLENGGLKILQIFYIEVTSQSLKNLQSEIFKKGSPHFLAFQINFIFKLQLQVLLFCIVYVISQTNINKPMQIINILIILSTLIANTLFILPNILLKFTKISNLEMLRNFDMILECIQEDQKNICKASYEFYELIKSLNRNQLQISKEQFIYERPYLFKQFLESLQPFQNQGRIFDVNQLNQDTLNMFKEINDLGITTESLGASLPQINLKIILQLMGVLDISLQEYQEIQKYTSQKNQDIDEEDVNYFSPMKLLIYSQLVSQEVQINPHTVVFSVLLPLIGVDYSQIEENKSKILLNSKLIQSQIGEQEEEEKKSQNNDSNESQDQKNEKNQSIDQDIIRIANLQEFLEEFVALNFIKKKSYQILIQEFKRIKLQQDLSLDRIAQFINHNIQFYPS